MSGIAAVWGICESSPLEKMLLKIQHRGSKTEVYQNSQPLVLGHISSSQEFFHTNGEEVIAGDGIMVPSIEASTLLAMISDQGPEILSKLGGSFALLANTREGPIAARDRFGQKPLYFGKEGENVFFASELKALPKVCQDVKPLPPGTFYRPNTGIAPYTGKNEFDTKATQLKTKGTAQNQLQEMLVRAVEKRLPSKGNLGVFLSGGLDSSIIAAISKYLTKDVQTFTAGYKESLDLRNARNVANYLSTSHNEYHYTLDEIKDILPKVIYHLESFDCSLVRSSIANYIVARLARQNGIDFILAGEGADELFGGYHYLKDITPLEQTKELKKLLLAGHNIGFQRVDRMTAAHSLDCAMPFMDEDIIQLSFSIPIEWKINGPEQQEKWILRQAFTGWLPSEILHRRKDEFSQGAGSAHLMEDIASQEITDAEFARECRPFPGYTITSKEELLYYRLFRKFFPLESQYETVGHWHA